MPRRKVNRTSEEEEEFLRHTRHRNKINQRRRRYKRSKFLRQKAKSVSERVQKCNAKKRRQFLPKNIDVTEDYLGPMNVKCCHCGARHFGEEVLSHGKPSFNDCCSHGTVPLPSSFDKFPKKLQQLFIGSHPLSTEFLSNIRSYNTTFSFASFNANLTNFNGRRAGPYCFKIIGDIYYQINPALYPENEDNYKYGQLFILDPVQANRYRMDNIPGLDIELLRLLDTIIRKYNIFAKLYSMMNEKVEQLENQSRRCGQEVPEVIMSIVPKFGMNARRYNQQQSNEVAVVFTTTADGDIPDSYVTLRNKHTGKLKYVSSMKPTVEPWIYPFFFPRGQLGWHPNLCRLNSNKRISRTAYVKNLMAVRDKFNPLHYGGRLSQQFYVDSYVKIEKDRIHYLRTHQKELRSDNYQGIMDYMAKKGQESNMKVGKIVILPSTFIGSPRNMAQNYQDAMAIVRKYGKPDLFVTMTCNPNWREIRENLDGRQPCDRPELVARVFHLKRKALIDQIVKKEIFKKVAAYVGVIEFQKRGLPHMHLLITLKKNYKISHPDIVDKFISAEIPDPKKDETLFNIVMQNMIHGPCGDWCKVKGKCSKHFPKAFQTKTTMDEDGYPYYRRRDSGQYTKCNGYVVDNRYVVPYSPKLLKMFNCHINVEVVSSIRAVKYLYKYIYKGHDAAIISMQGNASDVTEMIHDEISEHIETRYVGPVEACWRILGKSLQEKSHAVIRMPVHLPNQQNITINPGADDVTLQQILEQKNMLLDFFELNIRDSNARKYRYVDLPLHYTFVKRKIHGKYTAHWRKRKGGFKTIGRMYPVNPSETELFHLRLLLLTIKGSTSFEYLRTVNGQVYSSFTETCIVRGLVADDQEWKRAMNEAEVWMMPLHLRRLFVRILIHCNPLYPGKLWDDFKNAMSEDFGKHMTEAQAQMRALQQINDFLTEEGRNITDFPSMPLIDKSRMTLFDDNYYANILATSSIYYQKLNYKQREVVDRILHCVDNNVCSECQCFYIDGPGGSGKTFMYITLWHLLTGRRVPIQTMAFTGIAATLLPYGRTVHKTLGLPVPLYPDSYSTIKIGSKEAENLKKCKVFIWDEAPMAPRYALEIMNKLLQDIMGNQLPFGGKIVVLGGDFRQLLPVNPRGIRSETVNLSIKYSSVWNFFEIYNLTENMRTLPSEKEFSTFLLDIGDGKLNDNEDNVDLPDFCIDATDADIVRDIYGTNLNSMNIRQAAEYAILAARNIDIDDINNQVVDLLDIETEKIYTSVDSTEHCNDNDLINLDLVPEYLNTLAPTCLPPHELRLRQFSIVMLIRNLSISEGLCNGTRLLVLELGTNILRCEILTGDKAGEVVILHRISIACDNIYPFTFTRRQFPIKLAFAITINKSQGQTFKKIGIDLRKDVFNHGQLYVALSRVRAWDSLKIYIGNHRETTIIRNPVYKELYD